MTEVAIAGLDERSLILALQEVTEDVTARTSRGGQPTDADEARALLAALIQVSGHNDVRADELLEADQYAAARRVLMALAEDPATADTARAVLAEPPSDTRLGTELAVPAIAVLAGVIAWLQTKLDIQIKRKDGRTEFQFRVAKEAASDKVLKELAATVVRLWSGPPQK